MSGPAGPDLGRLSREGPVHFMGVAGAGMYALAELLVRSGGRVTGCDLRPAPVAGRLGALGIRVLEGHDSSHVEDASALIVSAAVPAQHPEVEAARGRGIPVLKRAQALGAWVNRGTVVAVAGTHGKTSSTAMLTEILAAAGRDPTGLVGGTVAAWGGNLRFGHGDLFVVEADEYDRSFHQLEPDVAVVTSVEADHLDIYGSLEAVREAFRTFVARVPDGGRVAACSDDVGASGLLAAVGDRAYSYGVAPGSQLRAVDVRTNGTGSRFNVWEEGHGRGVLAVSVPGLHNVRNALGAAAAARHLGVPWDAVRDGLARYVGVGRRFQRLGEAGGIVVVDDYAHHPTEIRATLGAARAAYPGRRIVAAFQPHLYTRTRDFAAEFGSALAQADAAWVTDVYPAREAPILGVSGELVAEAARAAGAREVHYVPDLDELAPALAAALRTGDVCLTLGAGSVEVAGPRLMELLKEGGEGA